MLWLGMSHQWMFGSIFQSAETAHNLVKHAMKIWRRDGRDNMTSTTPSLGSWGCEERTTTGGSTTLFGSGITEESSNGVSFRRQAPWAKDSTTSWSGGRCKGRETWTLSNGEETVCSIGPNPWFSKTKTIENSDNTQNRGTKETKSGQVKFTIHRFQWHNYSRKNKSILQRIPQMR